MPFRSPATGLPAPGLLVASLTPTPVPAQAARITAASSSARRRPGCPAPLVPLADRA